MYLTFLAWCLSALGLFLDYNYSVSGHVLSEVSLAHFSIRKSFIKSNIVKIIVYDGLVNEGGYI